jgi:hypothetical protein
MFICVNILTLHLNPLVVPANSLKKIGDRNWSLVAALNIFVIPLVTGLSNDVPPL